MEKNEIQIEYGEELKKQGMALATSHADAETPKWSETALIFLKIYINTQKGKVLMGEDIEEFATYNGLTRPPDKRAWGSVIKKASDMKLIEFVGYGKSKVAIHHRGYKALWKVL